MFAWSHTTYAEWHGMIFNFEWKRDLNYFLAHSKEAKRISSAEVWNKYHGTNRHFIRVFASDKLGANEYRRNKIKRWYAKLKGEKK